MKCFEKVVYFPWEAPAPVWTRNCFTEFAAALRHKFWKTTRKMISEIEMFWICTICINFLKPWKSWSSTLTRRLSGWESEKRAVLKNSSQHRFTKCRFLATLRWLGGNPPKNYSFFFPVEIVWRLVVLSLSYFCRGWVGVWQKCNTFHFFVSLKFAPFPVLQRKEI